MNNEGLELLTDKLKEINAKVETTRSALSSIKKELEECPSLENKGYPGKVANVRNELDAINNKITTLSYRLKKIALLYQKYEDEVVKIGNEGVKNYLKNDDNTFESAGIVTGIATGIANIAENISQISNAIAKFEKNGENLATITGGDPVNLTNGNFLYDLSYMEHNTPIPMRVRIFYNGFDDVGGILGRGWRHNFESKLIRKDNTVFVFDEDGEVSVFSSVNDIDFYPTNGTIGRLLNKDGSWIWTDRNRIQHIYDEGGMLLELISENGYCIQFTYEKGTLKRAIDSESNTYLYYLNSEGNLKEIVDAGGRRVRFEYENGRLITVENTNGIKQSFFYDNKGRMEKVIWPDGNIVLKNAYDDNDRVVSQSFLNGTSIKFIYNEGEDKVIEILQDGSQKVYKKDKKQRIVSIMDGDGTEEFTYNNYNQRTSEKSRRGFLTEYEYDYYGNIACIRNNVGNVWKIRWKDIGQPLEVTVDGKRIITILYDQEKGHIISEKDAYGSEKKYEYDNEGRLIKVSNSNRLLYEIFYGRDGRISSVVNSSTGKIEYKYDQSGQLISSINALGQKNSYIYDASNNLVAMIDAIGQVRKYQYDNNGRLIKKIDVNGGVTKYTYDLMGNIVEILDPDKKKTVFNYDKKGNLIKRVDADGSVTLFAYDWANRLISHTFPDATKEYYKYDKDGNRIRRVGRDGSVWNIEYDALNRPIALIDPMGTHMSAEYDAFGNVTSIHYDDGLDEKAEYDFYGKIISYTSRSGYCVRCEYNIYGDLKRVFDNEGDLIRLEYDTCGRLKRESYIDGSFRAYTYNELGLIVTLQSELGCLHIKYDNLNRITSIEQEQGNKEQYEYDAIGNIISITDGNGNRIVRKYSLAGALLSITDALGNKIKYEYDDCYRLTSAFRCNARMKKKDSLSHIGEEKIRKIRFIRDKCGRVIRMQNFDDSSISFFYDKCGRLNREIDEEGNEIQTKYRLDGYPFMSKISDGRCAYWKYNDLKQIIEITDWIGSMKIERDPLGKIKKVIDQRRKVISYKRNERGCITETTYPNGKKVYYNYDKGIRLNEIKIGRKKISYKYDLFGRLSNVDGTDGIKCAFKYLKNGSIGELNYSKGGKIIDEIRLSYDRRGRVTEVTKNGVGRNDSGIYNYDYDERGMLSKIKKDGVLKEVYAYDSFGNRIEKCSENKKTTYYYDFMDHLIEMQNSEGKEKYRYDKRGNLIQILKNGKKQLELEWDALNRLSRSISGKNSAEYSYNALQMRDSVTWNFLSGRKKEYYIYDISRPYNNLLAEENDKNEKNFVWGYGLEAIILPQDKIIRILKDNEINPIRSIGTQEETYEWDPFGVRNYPKDAADRRVLEEKEFERDNFVSKVEYSGYVTDPITGFLHAGYREYDPDKGRFISTDRINKWMDSSGILSTYIYCRNDPLNLADPDGEVAVGINTLIGVAIGGWGGIAEQTGEDIVKYICHEPLTSTWRDYMGAFVGGATSGGLYASGVDPRIASGVGSAVGTLTTNGLKMAGNVEGYRNEDGYNWKNLIWDTTKSGASAATTSFVFGEMAKKIEIPGITDGLTQSDSHSSLSDFNRQMTRSIRYGTKPGSKTVINGMLGVGVGNLAGTIWVDSRDEIEKEIKQKILRLLNRKIGANCSMTEVKSFV